MIKNFLNPEEHQNPINGSKLTAILLKRWILPIGGASALEGLRSMGLPRLVLWAFADAPAEKLEHHGNQMQNLYMIL